MSETELPAEVTTARHVTNLALSLFDHTLPLHGLDNETRQIIEILAGLLDAHIPHTKKKTFPNVLAYVRTQTDQAFTPEIEEVIAASLAIIQGKIKTKDIDAAGLLPAQQRQVLTLAALLKIAAGLNTSKSNLTTIQQVDFKGCFSS